jgi:hypothetical protein
MYAKLFFVLLGCVLAEFAHAQLTGQDNEDFQVVSTGRQGLMVYRRLTGRGEDQIELIRVDTALNVVWQGYIKIDRRLVLLHAEPKEEYVFLLFQNRQLSMGDFQIVAVKIDKGDYGTYTVKNLIPFNPTEFIITNEAALIGGYFNYRPLILHYNFSTQQSKILPGFFNEPGELTQIKSNADGSVDVIVSARNFEKRKSLYIRNYDALGDLVKTIVLQPDNDKNLTFGRSLKTPTGEQVVAGVYGRFSEYSRGIFVAQIDEFGEYKINYYNFGELQRFFNYMKAKREQRVKDRIERRKVKGKKLKFNYRILVQELVPYGDQFVMLGEAFYPHYSYPSGRSMAGFNNNMIPRSFTNPLVRGELVFDGYQYTHAVVIGFDRNGKLKWDNSFEINDVRTFQLQQFVKIIPEKDRIVLLYLFDNALRTKIIKNGEVLEGKEVVELRGQFKEDVIKPKETEKSNLDYWYGNTFFASGIHQVKNLRGSEVLMNRRVFFINKIVHQ